MWAYRRSHCGIKLFVVLKSLHSVKLNMFWLTCWKNQTFYVHFIVLLPSFTCTWWYFDHGAKVLIKELLCQYCAYKFKVKEQEILQFEDIHLINYKGDQVIKRCCVQLTVLGECCYEYAYQLWFLLWTTHTLWKKIILYRSLSIHASMHLFRSLVNCSMVQCKMKTLRSALNRISMDMTIYCKCT